MLEALINIKAEQINQCLLHHILICFQDDILFLSTHKKVEYVMTCLQKSLQYFNRLHLKITTASYVNIIIWRLGRTYHLLLCHCSTGKGLSAGLAVLLGNMLWWLIKVQKVQLFHFWLCWHIWKSWTFRNACRLVVLVIIKVNFSCNCSYKSFFKFSALLDLAVFEINISLK